MKTNRLFCYWLQGYFEIGMTVKVDKDIVLLISSELNAIEEPLGEFTQWLKEVCLYIESLEYNQKTCNLFSDTIQNALNSTFYHVIDNYHTEEKPREFLKNIHDGKSYGQ